MVGLLAIPPIGWLPPAGEAWMLLGALLGGQATIAALTLAVTRFVVRGVSERQASDDRTYDEYFEQSAVRSVFRASVAAVGVTALVLFAEEFVAASPGASRTPGLRNLALFAVVALATNTALPLILFERAVQLTRPDRWRALQRGLYERDVTEAVHAFLARRERVTDARDRSPDPGEERADDAVRALLGHALRAMSEWRQGDFEWGVESVGALVEFAMDELEREGIDWDLPGSVPSWPPLAEWHETPDSFREEVITRGRPWYASQLATLDRRLVLSGLSRSCGELFSAGLDGCVRNYELACVRGDPQLRDMLRNSASRDLEWVFHSDHAGDASYLREVIRLHSRLLFYAMRHEHADDFQWLRRALADMLANGKSLWERDRRPRPTDEEIDGIDQMSRYVVMGLAGYSISLAEAGSIADPDPYIEAGRSEYQSVGRLTADFALPQNLARELGFLWENLEMTGPDRFGTGWGSPGEYAPWFLALRLVELAEVSMPELGLDRRAAQGARWWFERNVDRVRSHVRVVDGPNLDARIVIVRDALRAATGPSG